jgi:hypothetical protein
MLSNAETSKLAVLDTAWVILSPVITKDPFHAMRRGLRRLVITNDQGRCPRWICSGVQLAEVLADSGGGAFLVAGGEQIK